MSSVTPDAGKATQGLYDRRFVLFSGKGGVGKTMMASAFALSCARRGKRTLLIELNVRDKVSPLFGSREVTSEIVEVEDNLFAVNVLPDAAMQEYALMILRVKLIYRAVFENRVVRSFLKVVPGLNELLMLGKAYFHVVETHPDGRPVWDMVVLDAPATGHGIFLFQIPAVITQLIGSGHMYEEAQRIQQLMQDTQRTSLVLVTLAEDMPVNETLMLRDVVRERLGLPMACVVVNGLYPPTFQEGEIQAIESLEDLPDQAPSAAPSRTEQALGGPGLATAQKGGAPRRLSRDMWRGLVQGARFRLGREHMQQYYLQKLREASDLPLVEIPYYFAVRAGFAMVRQAAKDLEPQLEALAGTPTGTSARERRP